jgi:hypothetical protein
MNDCDDSRLMRIRQGAIFLSGKDRVTPEITPPPMRATGTGDH